MQSPLRPPHHGTLRKLKGLVVWERGVYPRSASRQAKSTRLAHGGEITPRREQVAPRFLRAVRVHSLLVWTSCPDGKPDSSITTDKGVVLGTVTDGAFACGSASRTRRLPDWTASVSSARGRSGLDDAPSGERVRKRVRLSSTSRCPRSSLAAARTASISTSGRPRGRSRMLPSSCGSTAAASTWGPAATSCTAARSSRFQTGAIIVTFNYRLGALGWLSHADLATEEGVTTSPSQGLLDQQAALSWVHRNIAAFGGDPSNVTLAGGVGGRDQRVRVGLAAPGSKGLFAHAVIEIGVCQLPTSSSRRPPWPTTRGHASRRRSAAPQAAPSSRVCERRLPTRSLQRSRRGTPSLEPRGLVRSRRRRHGAPDGAPRRDHRRSVREGTDHPRDEPQRGRPLRLPLRRRHCSSTSTDVRASLGASVHVGADRSDRRALPHRHEPPPQAFSQIITDGVFACPTRRVARAFLAAQGVPAYLYQFTFPYVVPALPGVIASHSFEIPFVFRNGFLGTQLTDDELALADQVDGYWFRFPPRRATPMPESTRESRGPRTRRRTDTNLVIDTPIATNVGLKKATCDFLGRALTSGKSLERGVASRVAGEKIDARLEDLLRVCRVVGDLVLRRPAIERHVEIVQAHRVRLAVGDVLP